MNTRAHTPFPQRVLSFALAALLTAGMLGAIDTLATSAPDATQLARLATAAARG
jgi:hypothetical protein